MAKQRKAPPGTYWRGRPGAQTLWGRLVVKGREIRWSLRTGDVQVARSRYAARRQREIAASHYGDERKEWGDAVLAWTDHIIGNVSPNTVKRYAVSLRQVEPDLVGCYLDEIDKTVISGLVRRRKKNGATNATIRRDLVAVSSVLEFAEGEDWIDANAALPWLKKLKERRDPIVLPEPDHIRFVISRAPGLLAQMAEVAWKTGCRQEELVGLARSRLDFGRRQITVVGKGNKLRTLDMLDAHDVLARAPAHVRAKWVFWHDDGEPYRNVASRFRAIVLSAQKAARDQELPFCPFRFHDLRHRFAVDFLKDRRGGIYALQHHLGHSSVKVTEMYLAYLTAEEAALIRDEAGTIPGTAIAVSGAAKAEDA